jgi:hypothetical protein
MRLLEVTIVRPIVAEVLHPHAQPSGAVRYARTPTSSGMHAPSPQMGDGQKTLSRWLCPLHRLHTAHPEQC